MHISLIFNILAILLAPIVALRVEKFMAKRAEQKQRRIDIFKTLMTTRASRTLPQHVNALNSIDIEFYGNSTVIEKWNVYRDYLDNPPKKPTKESQDRWEEKCTTGLIDLLSKMSKLLGYSFDTVFIEKGIYKPFAHGLMEQWDILVRERYLGLLLGQNSLKVEFVNNPNIATPHTSPQDQPAKLTDDAPC